MRKRKIFGNIIRFFKAIFISLPVFLIGFAVFIIGICIIFSFLVGSLIMVATPLIAQADRSIMTLISGLPPMLIVYAGLALTSFTVFIYLVYIVLLKRALNSIKSIFVSEAYRGGDENHQVY